MSVARSATFYSEHARADLTVAVTPEGPLVHHGGFLRLSGLATPVGYITPVSFVGLVAFRSDGTPRVAPTKGSGSAVSVDPTGPAVGRTQEAKLLRGTGTDLARAADDDLPDVASVLALGAGLAAMWIAAAMDHWKQTVEPVVMNPWRQAALVLGRAALIWAEQDPELRRVMRTLAPDLPSVSGAELREAAVLLAR